MINLFNLFKSSLYGVFIYLGIKTGTVEILFYLMLTDSILGILKALRLGEKFSFKILAWGMVSKLTILIVPMIIALMGKALQYDFRYFVVAVINIIVVSEGISIVTNILSIKTLKKIENTDYVTMMLISIRKGLTKIIKKFINSIGEK